MIPCGSRSRRALGFIVAATMPLGCRQILGVDGYGILDGKRDGGARRTPDAGSSEFGPDGGYRSPFTACGGRVPLWTKACAECADSDEAGCAAAVACDATCRPFVECLDSCGMFTDLSQTSAVPNPGCMATCRDTTNGGVDNTFPASMNAFIGGKGCAYGVCAGGTRWGCVGNYHWPTPLVPLAHVRLGLPDILSAKLCDGTAVGCPAPSAVGDIDGGTFAVNTAGLPVRAASLDVDTSLWTRFAVAGTPPYFEFTVNDSTRTFLFYPGRPILSDETLSPLVPSLSDAFNSALFARANISLDPTKAALVVAPVSDCTGVFAPGVRVTLDGADALYTTSLLAPGGSYAIDTSAQVTAAGLNSAIFVNVEPKTAVVRGYYGVAQVASEIVELRAGATTYLQLYPSAGFE